MIFLKRYIKDNLFLLKGIINKQRTLIFWKRASLLLQKAIEENIDKPVNYLKNLIQNNQFQVQYRNLENLNIDEIKEIIKDQIY